MSEEAKKAWEEHKKYYLNLTDVQLVFVRGGFTDGFQAGQKAEREVREEGIKFKVKKGTIEYEKPMPIEEYNYDWLFDAKLEDGEYLLLPYVEVIN